MEPDDGRRDDVPERGSFLPRISVTRPVTVLMILSALLLLGVVALTRLPVQLMPSGYDPSFMSIRVPYPGANPAEVEEQLVLPLEGAMSTVRGIKEMNCRASNDSARCWMEFHPYVDMEETYNVVADRIERLRATEWPDDVEEVRVRRYNPDNEPSINIGIALPASLEDPYWTLQRNVVQPLERVPGVAQVDLEGVTEKQIFIEPDRDAMASHNVGLRQLVLSLRQANFALASGDVQDGGRELLVRSVARFESLEQIRQLPIRADGLRLGQVAAVRYEEPERERASRLDGRDAAIVEVFKESEANTVAVTSAVREAVDRLFADSPVLVGATHEVLFDQGEVIGDSIRQLRDTGLLGAMFAVVVLYLFLRRFRVTVLVALAIPVSLLCSLVVLYFAGGSINVVTMMGLLICTGMLVDNAVVVVENIDRYRRRGGSVRRAALEGASEIALALTMATITTVAVFLPMVVMSGVGMMRFFLTKLAIPVVVSILASLVVAMLFLPLAASVLLRSESDRAGRPRRGLSSLADGLYRWTLEPLHRLYVRVLGLTLEHRAVVVVAVLATLVISIVPFRGTETSIQGRHQRGGREARFWFSLPNSYGMNEADAWFRQVEAAFEAERDRLAIKHLQTRFWRNRGMVRAMIRDTDETDLTLEQAIEGLKEVAPSAPGVQMYVNWQRGSGTDASLVVTLYGEDTRFLAELSEEAERRLRTLPGLTSVEPDVESALEEVRIRVNREQAMRYGVSPETISGTVAAALRGQALPRFRTGEKEIEIRVQFPERDRQGIGRLAALDVPGGAGRRIPLEALAELSIQRGYGEIRRENRRTALNIKLNTTWSNLSVLRGQVAGVMDGMEFPRDYSWEFGGGSRWERQENGNMVLGLVLAIVFIYLIMGFLFESTLLPLAVMPSIVLSWVGVFWLLWATDAKLDMMAAIGLILLAGLVVNNGIVLVDLINRLRRSGMSRTDAMLEAGRLRFRPILMTAMTTIFGMLPMAFGSASFVGMPYSGLGRTFVGGLLSSTTLTLVVVPLFYTLLDDAGEALSVLVRGKPSRPDTAEVRS